MNAIYARQSIDKKDSLSIDGQIDLCKKYAGEDVEIFQDKGYSGKNTKRPAFTSLMQAVEAGRIDKIFVYRLDRFSRSIADFSRLWETLKAHKVEFHSATEQFDTSTPMGLAMLNIVLVFAQLERETIAERVKDNYLHRFKLGAWPGGPAPFGYDLARISDNGVQAASLSPNDKAQIVQRIFTMYVQPNASLRGIGKQLTEEGIPGPRREAWDNVTISRILHNPSYVKATADVYLFYLTKGLQISQPIDAFDGVHACTLVCDRSRTKTKYNAVEGQLLTVANHPGIIDADLWLQVQEKLSENRQISRANAGKHTWLTGLLKCAKCGYALKIQWNAARGQRDLVCSGRSNFSICDAKNTINLTELETEVAAGIDRILKEAKPETHPAAKQQTSEELLAIQQKIDRLVNALAESSEISAVYISKQIDLLHRQREELLRQTKAEFPKPITLDFAALSFEEKKLVAAQFIKRIEVEGNRVDIVWND